MTFSDWDFTSNEFSLDPVNYVSAPSSLMKIPRAPLTYGYGFIKTSVVPIDSVKQGCFLTFLRLPASVPTSNLTIYFRCQNVAFYPANTYGFEIQHLAEGRRWRVFKYKDNITTILYEKTAQTFPESMSWRKLKVTWFNSPKGIGVLVEKGIGAYPFPQLERLFPVVYDSENLWKTIGGRVGFLTNSYMGDQTNLDDTLIYGVVK